MATVQDSMMTMHRYLSTLPTRMVARRAEATLSLYDGSLDPLERYLAARDHVRRYDDARAALDALAEESE